MVEVEKRIRALEPDLAALSSEIQELSFPGHRTRGLFAETVAVLDVAGGAAAPVTGAEVPPLDAHLGLREAQPLEPEARESAGSELRLWQLPLARIQWFDHAKFKLVGGEFEGEDYGVFSGKVKFTGRARLRSGEVVAIRAVQDVVWRRESPSPSEEVWRIHAWSTRGFEWIRAATPFFEETLARALRDDALLARTRTSQHEELVRTWLADPTGAQVPEHFFAPSMDRHPGLAVADVDGDGLDDLYVMARRGRNQLLRNRGDGTFEEIAARVGLDIDGHSAAAVFADFDNDGDKDVVIARTLERSLYLENRDGRFGAPAAGGSQGFPYLASSLNAVDFDGDGLLDVYVTTYAARMVGSRRAPTILAPFLEPSDLAQLLRLSSSPEHVHVLNFFGPPNAMLRNLGGGRFEAVDNPVLRTFMNTYQAAWADYDLDGDPDAYLSNDFGPNQMLRNDGEGRFTDVTAETGTADVGFGMGVSWGDYDEDGRPDLYVSNMYSTAGKRITQRFAELDPSYKKMARGNTLFRNEGERFRHVSGVEPPDLLVESAGWSWGGQFADFDNDGDLDLLALSGYYSAPPEYAIPVDT